MRRSIEYIVVHHSATDPRASVEDIRKVHLERGFVEIGYHYLISQNGILHMGRPIEQEGAHAYGLNAESIGVCLIGNYQESKPPLEQVAALKKLLTELALTYKVQTSNIIGHCEVLSIRANATKTLCPGQHLQAALESIRDQLKVAN